MCRSGGAQRGWAREGESISASRCRVLLPLRSLQPRPFIAATHFWATPYRLSPGATVWLRHMGCMDGVRVWRRRTV